MNQDTVVATACKSHTNAETGAGQAQPFGVDLKGPSMVGRNHHSNEAVLWFDNSWGSNEIAGKMGESGETAARFCFSWFQESEKHPLSTVPPCAAPPLTADP